MGPFKLSPIKSMGAFAQIGYSSIYGNENSNADSIILG